MAQDILGEKKYFAAANSGTGFQSYYKYIFDSNKFDSLIIIKGGSGTGKSSFARKLARECEKRGGQTEYFYCSSDPASLDGVILTLSDGRRIAALDGTAPHMRDTELPGCCDVLHDTGKYWNVSALAQRREEIERYVKERKERFKDVYCHLSAALAAERIADRIIEKNTDIPKLDGAVSRIFRKIGVREGKGTVEYRLTDSIGMRGRVRFNTFCETADTVYRVTGAGWKIFFSRLIAAISEKKADIVLSPYFLDTESFCGVLLTDTAFGGRVAFVRDECDDTCQNEDRIINTARFSEVKEKQERREIKKVQKLSEASLLSAEESFSEIRGLHFILEEIYSEAMDFKRKDREEKAIIDALF